MNPPPNTSPQSPRAAVLVVWWAIWTAIVGGLIVIHLLGPGSGSAARKTAAPPNVITDYIAIGNVVISSLLRWLLLPRLVDHQRALTVFVIGLSLAESCGILGTFLSSHPTALFALSLAALLQWAPVFIGKLLPPEPAPRRGL